MPSCLWEVTAKDVGLIPSSVHGAESSVQILQCPISGCLWGTWVEGMQHCLIHKRDVMKGPVQNSLEPSSTCWGGDRYLARTDI